MTWYQGPSRFLEQCDLASSLRVVQEVRSHTATRLPHAHCAPELLLLALESPFSWFGTFRCFSDALEGDGRNVLNGFISRFLPEPYNPDYDPPIDWEPTPIDENGSYSDISQHVPPFPFPGFSVIDYGKPALLSL